MSTLEFKKGDKVRCVDRGENFFITVGKSYEVTRAGPAHIFVKNNMEVVCHYSTKLFELVEDEIDADRILEALEKAGVK